MANNVLNNQNTTNDMTFFSYWVRKHNYSESIRFSNNEFCWLFYSYCILVFIVFLLTYIVYYTVSTCTIYLQNIMSSVNQSMYSTFIYQVRNLTVIFHSFVIFCFWFCHLILNFLSIFLNWYFWNFTFYINKISCVEFCITIHH